MTRFRKPLKDEERSVTDPGRARRKTFDRAVNLLTYKPRSENELRSRLLEKPWTNREIVDDVIRKLSEYNYLNDEEFAATYASSRLRQKAIGRRRLKQDLRRKKLDSETIEAALEKAFDVKPESELIAEAIEKRLRIKGEPESFADKKKLFDHLMRLGFEYDLIRDALRKLPIDDPER